ncbi:3D domain-containing protein [Maribacter sp. 2308TA10-17]|uniref:3D domain-containing protein n=1 Tax=Maribacter sp. 2308TA10-17 TaxID=3386276 RepID=UPI0039BC4229
MDKWNNIYRSLTIIGCCFYILLWSSCQTPIEDKYVWKSVEVTATAYNSVTWQTQGNPIIAAWGDSLKSDIPSIAVSRNLIALGLKHNTPVKIEGFDSIFLVKDKMHRRWRNRIDIYMGKDVKKAKAWGRKKLTILYGVPKDSIQLE